MMFRKTTFLLLTLLLVTGAYAQQTFTSLDEALNARSIFSGANGPQNIQWIDNGSRFSYNLFNRESGKNEIRSYNPATSQDALVFDGTGVTFPGTSTPFAYNSFSWTADSKYLFFASNFRAIYRRSGISDFYVYSIADKSLKLVARDAGTAELSPDGAKVGFQRGGDIYTYTFATNSETRLTHDGSEHVFNGRFGWVYEEEFGLAQAWTWSHDSRYIAFWQEDETEVPLFQMTDYEGAGQPQYTTLKYPKVGQTNPTMRIGVVDVTSGDARFMETGEHPDSYIPRIYWTSVPGQLSLIWMNREQNHLKMYFFDVASGAKKLVLEETSDTWIDVYNFFEGIDHHVIFPSDSKDFFWISDRDGFRHVYQYGYDGKLIRQVTTGKWDVTNLYAYDAKDKLLFYGSTEASPLERHLYVIGTNGRGKQKLTTEAGRHTIDMGPNAAFFIDRYSNIDTPTQVLLKDRRGRLVRALETNDAVKEAVKTHAYSKRNLYSFTTSEGVKLDAMILYPHLFDSTKKYPVILDIYGGPGSQSVYNQWESNNWRQYLTQQGYIIVSVNNRGSSGYGRDFEKQVYLRLGELEAIDFKETADHLSTLPYVDGDRIAIRGHSYGGYMVLYAMTAHPGRFKVGISGAPVSDWRLYDTIYTERYMGLIGQNEAGYVKSSPTTRASQMKGKLLLVHSSMDENVHVQHTFQFAKGLIDNRIDHDLRIFPPGAHGVSYNRASYLYLMTLYTDYLGTHL
jgi:dipeptidyl-peptidase-4